MEEMIKILNGIILKHRTNLVESTPDYNSASEIASLWRGFEEWKDHFYFSYDGKVYMQKTEAEPKTLDELFSYWYQNVKSKNN